MRSLTLSLHLVFSQIFAMFTIDPFSSLSRKKSRGMVLVSVLVASVPASSAPPSGATPVRCEEGSLVFGPRPCNGQT